MAQATAETPVRNNQRPPRTLRRRIFTMKRVTFLFLVVIIGLAVGSAFIPTTRWITGDGYLMTDQEVELRPSVEGAIERWHVRTADHVERGQLLIQLNDSVQRAAYEQALSQLESMRRRLDQLRSNQVMDDAIRKEQIFQAERSMQLANTTLEKMLEANKVGGSFSPKEIDDARLRVDLASSRLAELQVSRDDVRAKEIRVLEEQIESAQKTVALREAELALRRIESPISGTIMLNRYEPGEVVKPEHVLGQVFDEETWIVKLKLPERDVVHVKPGQPVEVALAPYPTLLYGYFNATVTKVLPVVSPRATGDGIFYVEAELELPEGVDVKPGFSAWAYIDAGQTTWLYSMLGW